MNVHGRDRLPKFRKLGRLQTAKRKPFSAGTNDLIALDHEFPANLLRRFFVDSGKLCKRLKKEFASTDRLWASWGDYDRRQFERVCQSAGIGYPFGLTHLNVKTLFAVSLGLSHEVGLDGACQRIGMPMEGTHHRGDDDAWNIAAILCRLLARSRVE